MTTFDRHSSRRQALRRVLIALPILGAGAPSLRAADRYWINSGGGNFTGTANWSTTAGGAGGASVPTGSDRAIFRIAGTPSPSYTVNFPRSLQFPLPVYSMNQLRIDAQKVKFLDSGLVGEPGTVRITDTSTNPTNRGLVLGELNGVAELHTTLAHLEATAINLGRQGRGELHVEGGMFTVTGSSETDFEVLVGGRGPGLLSVTNGGHMNVNGQNASVFVGTDDSAPGEMLISGAGAEMTITGDLQVGFFGGSAAQVTVQEGGLLNTASATIKHGIFPVNYVSVAGPGSQWTNSGDLKVEDELRLSDHATVTVGGQLVIENSDDFFAPAELLGQGTINGDVLNHGVVRPLYAANGGALHVEGDYIQDNGNKDGKLVIEILNVSTFSRLEVSGDITLDGLLEIVLPPDLQMGDFDIFDWGGARHGAFNPIYFTNYPPQFNWDIDDFYVNGVIRLVPRFLADFDLDADVDHVDLALWKGGLGAVGNATRLQGDANGDLNVDGRDYLIWQQEFGSDATPAVANGENVPEPGAWALWLMAAAMAWAPRRAQ